MATANDAPRDELPYEGLPPNMGHNKMKSAAWLIAAALVWATGLPSAHAEDQLPHVAKGPTSAVAAAKAAKAALKSGDDEALQQIASAERPDPWTVAEALCADGDHDVAAALAEASDSIDIRALPAYVERMRSENVAQRRERLREVLAAIGGRDAPRVIALTDDVEADANSVAGVRLLEGRGRALLASKRIDDGLDSIARAMHIARDLGWLRATLVVGDFGVRAANDHFRSERVIALNRVIVENEILRGNTVTVLQARSRTGLHQQILGRLKEARATNEKIIEEAAALGEEGAAVAAVALGNLAVVFDLQGDPKSALKMHKQAYERLTAAGNAPAAGQALINQAAAEDSLGRSSKALATSRRALALFKELGEPRGLAQAHNAMGSVRHGLGDFAQALGSYETAIELQKSLGDHAAMAATLLNMAGIYGELGDAERATTLFKRVVAIANQASDRHLQSIAVGNLATALVEKGEVEEAVKLYGQSIAMAESLGNRALVATMRGNVGNALLRSGDYARAIKALENAKASLDAIDARSDRARMDLLLAHAYARTGKRDEAIKLLEDCVREARRLRARPLLVKALQQLAELYLKNGESSRALDTARRGTEAIELMLGGLDEELGANAREMLTSLFAVGTLAAIQEEDLPEAVGFLESGRAGALLDALGKREQLRWKAESLPQDLRAADDAASVASRAARREYNHAVRGGSRKAVRAASRVLDAADEQVRAIAGRIQRELKQQASLFYPRPETMEAIHESLTDTQALVVYAIAMDEALAVVFEPNDIRVVSLGAAQEILRAVATLNLSDPEMPVGTVLNVLRKRLVDPLELPDEVQSVLISPEGPLSYIPYGALFNCPVTMTPSGTTHVVLGETTQASGEGILAIGAPDYQGTADGTQRAYFRGRTLAPLPGARLEVEAIGSKTLMGTDANESAFYEAVQGNKRWRAVHFACHGFVNVERPMLSALALTQQGDDDGFLTALEILRAKIPADLAVLSACETGKGRIVRGEGIVGLTRAFMFAGAPRVICSLWKVDDEATRALMVKFYERWHDADGTKRMSAAQALREAQAFVRGHKKWAHPYYWAAWVLWGLPD